MEVGLLSIMEHSVELSYQVLMTLFLRMWFARFSQYVACQGSIELSSFSVLVNLI